MKNKTLILVIVLLCSIICMIALVGCNPPISTITPPPEGGGQSGNIEPTLPSGNEQEENTKPTQPEEKKIPVNVYIDGRVSEIIYANATTGRITPPEKPQDITTNPNSEKYFYGWFTDSNFQTPYTYDTTFDGRQNLYGKWITVYTSSYKYTVDKGVATITGYNRSNDTVLVIPAYINSFPVKSISSDAFKDRTQLRTVILCNGIETVSGFIGCNSITTVILPESVTTIGDSAFQKCDSLTDLDFISSSVTSLGSQAFRGCSGFTNIKLPNSVLSIGFYTFAECSSITNIEIPSSVTSIGAHAFDKCSSISKFDIPNSVTNIGYGAFSNCSSLVSMKIPDGVTKIDTSTFENCSSLTSIEIPSSVKEIGYTYYGGAFSGCSSLTNVTFGDDSQLTSIGYGTFSGCSSLESIEIPSGVTEINSFAFSDCSSLESIEIPSGITYLSDSIFSNCSNIIIISIPNKVTSISSSAFKGCSKLKSIEVPSSVEYIGKGTFSGCSSLESMVLPFVGGGKIYEAGATLFGYIFGVSMYTGGVSTNQYYDKSKYYTFYIPSSLKSVKITGGNVSFGAFSGCSNLEMIEIPSNVTRIEGYAFYNCSSLTNIEIPRNLTYISDATFKNCSSLKSIEIPSSVETISKGAFSGCSDLESMTLPFVGGGRASSYGVQDIGLFGYIFGNGSYTGGEKTEQFYAAYESAIFYIPSNLKQVIVSGGSLYRAFYNCSNLTDIEILEGVTIINDYAFSGCSSLTRIVMPSSVTRIGFNAFDDCSSLTGVYISDIASWCAINFGNAYANPLYNAKNLYLNNQLVTDLVIPNYVTSIGDYAFKGCSSLENITVDINNAKYKSEGNCIIEKETNVLILGCKNSVIPNYVTSIGSFAFDGCSSLTSITIPSSITSIGDCAFDGCSSLTSIEIPSSVTSIGKWAFEYCSSLTSVVIPSSVTSIGWYAFYGCNKLIIFCEAKSKPSGWDNSWNPSNCQVIWGYEG
ncbi:MAG: leucine-rich repeat domain-containing protein [Clostridia bacterium]|nr:leucine-rich repeat domain-containing protein [Clostridia bacterium]